MEGKCITENYKYKSSTVICAAHIVLQCVLPCIVNISQFTNPSQKPQKKL